MARFDDDGLWVVSEVTERSGPAYVQLYAQPPKDELPKQTIGNGYIHQALAEKIDDGKVSRVKLLDEPRHPMRPPATITAQVVRNPRRKSDWYLTIPDPEEQWRVMMDPEKVWGTDG